MIQVIGQGDSGPPYRWLVLVGDNVAVAVAKNRDISAVQLLPRLVTYEGGYMGPVDESDPAAQAEAREVEALVAAHRATVDLPEEKQAELFDDTVARINDAARAGTDISDPAFPAQLADELTAETGLGEPARPWAQQTIDDAYVASNNAIFGGEYIR